MIDFRILALGAMALLMAVYGSSSASGTSLKAGPTIAMHRAISGDAGRHAADHVDGFDLRNRN